jgi:hypothetical protein
MPYITEIRCGYEILLFIPKYDDPSKLRCTKQASRAEYEQWAKELTLMGYAAEVTRLFGDSGIDIPRDR